MYYGTEENNPFEKKKDNISYIVDVLFGVMCICHENFKNVKGMALKVGGFPSEERLDFFKIIRKHHQLISFEELVQPSTDTQVVGISQNENVAMDPRQLFQFFSKDNQGLVGFEEFYGVVQYMGLKLPNSKQLAIFSRSDKGHTGTLDYFEFSHAIQELKMIVILETIESLGISIRDLVISFVGSIILLLMLFIFIFIGISAFSPVSSFSSVTNSILPLVGGLAVNKQDEEEGEGKDADYKNAVEGNLN
jgi:Ca2+-binding EF-hand superfamily protein